MAYLFIIEDKIVKPNAETLLISPFKEIWQRDNSQNKEIALQEFTYIEFMSSAKKSNPYRGYPEKDKPIKIKEAIIKLDDWQPDDLIQQGINHWIKFQTEASPTYQYWLAAKTAAEKMKDFFIEVDINEKNQKSGNPLYKPRDITSALNDTEKILANLKALEKKVEEELYEETKTRSNKQISTFADPNSLRK